MQEVTDIEINSLKYARWKKGLIAGKMSMVGRLSFVGELGYEVHCRREDAEKVNDVIMDQVLKHGGCMAGYRTMESMSTEVGFHHWPHSINISDNPVEARLLQFCAKTRKYVGSEKVAQLRKEKPEKILACVTVDSDVPMYGHETIWRNGKVVGDLRGCDFSYALNTNLGWGYVHGDHISDVELSSGKYEVERMAVKYPAKVSVSSPFDPTLSRIRGKYDPQLQEELVDMLNKLKTNS